MLEQAPPYPPALTLTLTLTFKHMLEQAHERWLRERQELFRDALNKVDADATLQPRAPSLPPRAPSPHSCVAQVDR